MIHLAVHLKLHCKSTILQLKKKKEFIRWKESNEVGDIGQALEKCLQVDL